MEKTFIKITKTFLNNKRETELLVINASLFIVVFLCKCDASIAFTYYGGNIPVSAEMVLSE